MFSVYFSKAARLRYIQCPCDHCSSARRLAYMTTARLPATVAMSPCVATLPTMQHHHHSTQYSLSCAQTVTVTVTGQIMGHHHQLSLHSYTGTHDLQFKLPSFLPSVLSCLERLYRRGSFLPTPPLPPRFFCPGGVSKCSETIPEEAEFWPSEGFRRRRTL